MTASIIEVNAILQRAAESLRLERPDAPICALELADGSGAAERLALAQAALNDGAAPSAIGLTFVVTVAELAYQVDWEDHFSFWPRIRDLMQSGSWDPTQDAHRNACTTAFEWFAKAHGGLRPAGRFSEAFPHMSWPLSHAVLPRAAHRRMARLLAAAAADPRLVLAADGCPDEAALGELIRSFALTERVPTYFEGLLGNPVHIGRVAALLLKSGALSAEGAGRPWLVDRILTDLRKDRISKGILEDAVAETTERRREAIARALPPPALALGLTLVREQLRPRVELSPFAPEVKEAPAVRAALDDPRTRLEVNFGGNTFPCGSAGNLRFGPVRLPVRWPAGVGAIDLSLRLVGTGVDAAATKYFARSSRQLSLPLAFTSADRVRFDCAERVTFGVDAAVVMESADASRVAPIIARLGVRRVSIEGADKLIALVGRVDEGHREAWRRFWEVLRLGVGDEVVGAPALVPPLRSGPGWAEWLDDADAFVFFAGVGPASATFIASGDHFPVALHDTPTGVLAHVAASRGAGVLSLAGAAGSTARFEVRRRPKPRHREAVQRFRARLVPRNATVEHLLSDSCGVALEALPGVRLRVGLQTDDSSAYADVEERARSPLATSTVLASLWRQLGRDAAERAGKVTVLVEDQDADLIGARHLPLERTFGFVGFRVEQARATAFTQGELRVAGLERYFPPSALTEGAGEAVSGDVLTRDHPPGIYLARTDDGDEAAIAWAPSGLADEPAISAVGGFSSGRGAALRIARRLRHIERAAAGPRASMGAALMMLERAAAFIRTRLVASLCGPRWMAAERECAALSVVRGELARRLAPLLWIPRTWLTHDLPELVSEGGDLVSVVEMMCRNGVGESISREDARPASHVALLFSRASLAPPDEDEPHLAWAAANPVRPRLIRLLALVLSAAQRPGAADA